jgi:hypothetical protein
MNKSQLQSLDSIPLLEWVQAVELRASKKGAAAKKKAEKVSEEEKKTMGAVAKKTSRTTKHKHQFKFIDSGFTSGHCPDREKDPMVVVSPNKLVKSKSKRSQELFTTLSRVICGFQGMAWEVSTIACPLPQLSHIIPSLTFFQFPAGLGAPHVVVAPAPVDFCLGPDLLLIGCDEPFDLGFRQETFGLTSDRLMKYIPSQMTLKNSCGQVKEQLDLNILIKHQVPDEELI